MNYVLISSAIHTTNTPLSYANCRSMFTHEERFIQTLKTIESIRKYIPNSYIVLMEGTVLKDEYLSVFTKVVDHVHKAYEISNVVKYVNSPHKGLGETWTIHSYLQSQHFKLNKNKINSITKISGRYQIQEGFVFEVDNDAIMGKIVNALFTFYYTVGKNLINMYLNLYHELITDNLLNKGGCLEYIFTDKLKERNIKIISKDKLYVSGKCAVNTIIISG